MADKDLQMQRKKSDGSFDKYYPKTKTHLVVDDTTGQTIKEQYVNIVNGTTKVGNADKLDNKDSSEFANSIHSHTKANIIDFPSSLPANGGNADTVGNVALAGLAESKDVGSADLNTIIKSGMYRCGVNANSPGGLSYGQLLVIHGAGDTITQIYGNYNNGVLYTRSGNPPNVGGSGSWSAWRRLLVSTDIVNNLTIDTYNDWQALSAYQGKVIADRLVALEQPTVEIITYTRNWTVPTNVYEINVCVTGGGGGGGAGNRNGSGGGGGGGGITFIEKMKVTPNQQFPVVIGAGGTAGYGDSTTYGTSGSAGGDSSFNGYKAAGGGGGYAGGTGSSGSSSGVGQGGISPSGNHGGGIYKVDTGINGISNLALCPYIPMFYAGGGGSGWYNATYIGGVGSNGGANGAAAQNTVGSNAVANKGGGGGGGGYSQQYYSGGFSGGTGGSGVVIISY